MEGESNQTKAFLFYLRVVASNILAKSLCHMLARIVTDRGGGYQNVSVAFPLEDGSNQRRPIIQASRPEREPD